MEHRREAVIDLGTYRHDQGAEPEPDPPWPGWARLRRFPLRRWLPPALAVLLLVPLAGAAGVPPQPLEPLWTLPAGELSNAYGLAVDEQHLYVPSEAGEGWMLIAHRIEDGRVDWRAPIEGGENVSVSMVGSVPVATRYRPEGGSGLSTGYDPDSGRRLWSRPGYPFQLLAGRIVLAQGEVELEGDIVITAVDPATGETAGAVRLGESERQWAVRESPAGAIEVFTLARDGLLTRYDLASGEALATAQTPHVERLQASYQNTLAIVDGVLMVMDEVAEPPVVATYDPATLAPDASVTGEGEGYAVPCGPVVCVVNRHEASPSVRGIELGTGRTAWSVSCDDCTELRPMPLPGDRVWLESWTTETGTETQIPRSWVVDAGTGEQLTERTGWSMRLPAAATGALLNRREGEETLEPRAPPARIWWAWWDTDRANLTVLGVVEAHTCASYLPYLVCAVVGEAMTVWRIRP